MSYVQYGPFEDGGAPGISSSFLNPLETFLLSINSAAYDANISSNGSGVMTLAGMILNGATQFNPSSTVLNGGTAGTATLYQPFTGTFKYVFIVLSGFRTAGANQTIALPTAFTSGCNVRTGHNGSATGFNGFQLLSSGSAQTINVATALASGGGTTSPITTMFGDSSGSVQHAFDTIQFMSSSTSAANGIIELIGQ